MFVNKFVQNAVSYSPKNLSSTNKVRLHLNENPYPPSPLCAESLKKITLSEISQYSLDNNQKLIKSVSDYYDVDPENIFLNYGAASVIQQIIHASTKANDVIAIPRISWDYYRAQVQLNGCNLIKYDLAENTRSFDYEIKLLLPIIADSPKLIIINSPHMPTGGSIDLQTLHQVASTFKDALILVDQAYWGFDNSQKFPLRELISTYPNLIFSYTLSKFFGLAGLRIGFGIGISTLVNHISKISPLFGVSKILQDIAISALSSKDYYENISNKIRSTREKFIASINTTNSYYGYESKANFVLIRLNHICPKYLTEYLFENGFHVRECSNYALNRHIRVTIGKDKTMEILKDKLYEYLILTNTK